MLLVAQCGPCGICSHLFRTIHNGDSLLGLVSPLNRTSEHSDWRIVHRRRWRPLLPWCSVSLVWRTGKSLLRRQRLYTQKAVNLFDCCLSSLWRKAALLWRKQTHMNRYNHHVYQRRKLSSQKLRESMSVGYVFECHLTLDGNRCKTPYLI